MKPSFPLGDTGRLQSLAHKWLVPHWWLYIGYSLLIAWQQALFLSPLISSSSYAIIRVHLIAMATVAVAALAITLNADRWSPLVRNAPVTVAMGALGAIGTLAIVSEMQGNASLALVLVGYVFSALSMTWQMLSWYEKLSVHGLRKAIVSLTAATLVGTLLFVSLADLPQAVSVAIYALFPLIGTMLARRSVPLVTQTANPGGTERPPSEAEPDTDPLVAHALDRARVDLDEARPNGWLHGLPLRMLFIVLALSSVAGAMRTTGGLSTLDLSLAGSWLSFSLGGAAAALIACIVALFSYRRSILFAFYLALPLMSLGCIALSSDVPVLFMTGQVMTNMGSEVVRLLVWTLVINEAIVRRRPALGILSATVAAQFLGLFIGQGMGSSTLVSTQACVYASLLAILCVALVLVGIGNGLTVAPEALDDRHEDLFERRVRALAETARLSARETQVLSIWAAGHTGTYVEETLSITKNTVKTHLSHIYTKTGAANREELVSLLESIDVE